MCFFSLHFISNFFWKLEYIFGNQTQLQWLVVVQAVSGHGGGGGGGCKNGIGVFFFSHFVIVVSIYLGIVKYAGNQTRL